MTKSAANKFNRLAKNPGHRDSEILVTVVEFDFINLMKLVLNEPEIAQTVVEFFAHFDGCPAGAAPLCACCDNEWPYTRADARSWPHKLLVSIPNGATAKDIGAPSVMAVSVICRECAPLSDREIAAKAAAKMPGWKLGSTP